MFHVLMDGLIAEAAAREQVGLELVSVDSTIVRPHHDRRGWRWPERPWMLWSRH